MIIFETILFFIVILIAMVLFWPLKKRYYLFAVSVISFSAIAIALYWLSGHPALLKDYFFHQHQSQEVKKVMARFKNTEEVIAAMKKAIALHPEKAKGWYLLGRLYQAQQNPGKAAAAFKKAYTLAPNSMNYTFAYLQSLYVLSHQQRTPVIHQLINQIKTRYPNPEKMPPAMLDFLAYDAYLHHEDENAILYWEALLPYLEKNSKAHQTILEAIGKAQKRLIK